MARKEDFLIPFTKETASEAGRKGGAASGVTKRRRKALREALKAVLEEEGTNGLTKQEMIVKRCMENLFKKGEMKDLKILAELLGENVIKMELKTPQIVVKDEEEKAIVEDLMNVGNEVYEDI